MEQTTAAQNMKTVTITIPAEMAFAMKNCLCDATIKRFDRWFDHVEGKIEGGSKEGAWIVYEEAKELREMIYNQLDKVEA